jgi:hypothetical protein
MQEFFWPGSERGRARRSETVKTETNFDFINLFPALQSFLVSIY